MESALLWSSVALLALAGWAATLFVVTKALIPQAKALETLQRVDTLIDNRIRSVVERIQQRQGKLPDAKTVGSRPTESPDDAAASAIRDIFGSAPLLPIDEQPESGIEVVE